MASELGDAPIDIEQGREIIRGVADRIPVRPGPDGVPIAELSLNEEMPLAAVGVGPGDIGVVAGGAFQRRHEAARPPVRRVFIAA